MPCVLILPVVDSHSDRLELADRSGYRREGPLCGFAAQSPVVRPLRPEHPGSRMSCEFCRHEETVGPRCRLERVAHALPYAFLLDASSRWDPLLCGRPVGALASAVMLSPSPV